MKLQLEPTPGDSINDCAERAQKIADHFDVTVQFRFNGNDCSVRPGGNSSVLVENFENRDSGGAVLWNREPTQKHQYPHASMTIREHWPPAGMVIQIRETENDHWIPAIMDSVEPFRAVCGLKGYDISHWNIEWRYLPAPDVWPEKALEWLAMSDGSYRWMSGRVVRHPVGEVIHAEYGNATVLHVEHRPEGK